MKKDWFLESRKTPDNFGSTSIISQLKACSSVDSLHGPGNTVLRYDSEKCKLINDYFASVFTTEDSTSIPLFYMPQVVHLQT